MKTLIGVVLVFGGVLLGLYVGVWMCFIGGIIAVIEAAKMNPIDSMGIALGLLRFVCSGIAGSLSAICLIIPGKAMLE